MNLKDKCDVIVSVGEKGNRLFAFDYNGKDFTSEISSPTRKKAWERNVSIGRVTTPSGAINWRLLDQNYLNLARFFVKLSRFILTSLNIFDFIHNAIQNGAFLDLVFVHAFKSTFGQNVEMSVWIALENRAVRTTLMS